MSVLANYFVPERDAKYCNEYVCMFICLLFVRLSVSLLPVAVTRSSSDGVAIRYALPVSWITSRFYTIGPMGRIKHDVMFRRVCQVPLPVGRQATAVCD